MRTFHIGGVGQVRTEQSTLEARTEGVIRLENCQVVSKKDYLVVMNRHGELVIHDDSGRERERYALTYGAKLLVSDGVRVKPGQMLSEWDPFSMPIVTEVGGVVKYGDVIEGVTMQEQLDEVTGLSRKGIIESKDTDVRPRISLKDDAGNTKKLPSSDSAARYFLHARPAQCSVAGDRVNCNHSVTTSNRTAQPTCTAMAKLMRGRTAAGLANR